MNFLIKVDVHCAQVFKKGSLFKLSSSASQNYPEHAEEFPLFPRRFSPLVRSRFGTKRDFGKQKGAAAPFPHFQKQRPERVRETPM